MPAGERRLLKMLPRSIPRPDRSIVRSRGENAGLKELEEEEENALEVSNGCDLYLAELGDAESGEGEGRDKAVAVRQAKRNNFCCERNIISGNNDVQSCAMFYF